MICITGALTLSDGPNLSISLSICIFTPKSFVTCASIAGINLVASIGTKHIEIQNANTTKNIIIKFLYFFILNNFSASLIKEIHVFFRYSQLYLPADRIIQG